MPELKSMKLSKKEQKEGSEVATERPEYAYGLSINLDNESLEKLGITELPKTKTEMFLSAKVEVSSVSEHDSADQKEPNRSVTLQITEMGLANADTDKAQKLYGDDSN